MLKDAFFSALAVIVVVVLAASLGPKGPTGPPDPTLPGANPRPEWPFLWLFALLSLSPPGGGNVHHPGLPGAADRRPVPRAVRQQPRRTRASRRPVAVLVVCRDLHGPGRADYQGATAPWSPEMAAWSGDPVPEDLVRKRARRCSCRARACSRTRTAATATPWKAPAAGAAPT